MSRTDSKVPTDEKEVPTDIIIFANGYEAGEWLHPLDVTGKGGKSLYQTWNERGGSQAYMGTAMDGSSQTLANRLYVALHASMVQRLGPCVYAQGIDQVSPSHISPPSVRSWT